MIKHLKKIPSFRLFQEHVSLFVTVIQLSIISFVFIPSINAGTKLIPISEPNDWTGIIDTLSKAKMTGQSIWISLLPPSKTPPICPTYNYSEPYRLDFISWAKEIANLSLRYSSLTGYTIEDLQENLNLGYIRQTYIDSMEAESKSINPKLQFITTLPNIYYVDNNATGNGSGSSWANAATSIAGLNWTNITGGDTIYVSGGTDSTVYPKDNVTGKVVTNGIITITRGKDTGHNGRVIFAQSGVPTGSKSSFELLSCQNIKLYGLTFKTAVSNYYGEAIVKITGCTNCTIDHDTIYNNIYGHGGNDGGNGFAIYMNGSGGHPSKKNVITNNYIECFTNNNPARADDGRDPIWIGNNYGGHTITGNSIISHDAYTTNSHPDLIQLNQEGSDSNFVFTTANNLMMMTADTSANGQCFYSTQTFGNRFLIYNNIMVNSANPSTGITIRNYYAGNGDKLYTISARIFNNTISTNAAPLTMYDIDTLIVENNVIINTATSNQLTFFLDSMSVSETAVLQVDYNHYYRSLGTNTYFVAPRYGSVITFSSWQGMGYDTHGDTGPVIFNNFGGYTPADYRIMNFYNSGTDLSGIVPALAFDILGTPRSQGTTWDLGAFEHTP